LAFRVSRLEGGGLHSTRDKHDRTSIQEGDLAEHMFDRVCDPLLRPDPADSWVHLILPGQIESFL